MDNLARETRTEGESSVQSPLDSMIWHKHWLIQLLARGSQFTNDKYLHLSPSNAMSAATNQRLTNLINHLGPGPNSNVFIVGMVDDGPAGRQEHVRHHRHRT
jgi:hypothetical protein